MTRWCRLCVAAILAGAAFGGFVESPRAQSRGAAPDAPEPIDYLTFAQGAVPVSIGGASAKFQPSTAADFEDAVQAIDGNPRKFSMIGQAVADTDTEFVYKLPALTTFDRFSVPEVTETPAPNQTFFRTVEVYGSTTSATSGWTLLASGNLQTHKTRGLSTALNLATKTPVRWVKLRLLGGINVMTAQSWFDFSEIVGNGSQEAPEDVTHFNGAWRTMGLRAQLRQRGPLVTGCYDRTGELSGTVSGTVLRATGLSRSDKRPSAFILSVAEDGSLRGVRSDNNGPFAYYTVAPAPADTPLECGQPTPPSLGCGSVIHGINFDFDSATIRPESGSILSELFRGLQSDSRARIVIEGHTSSEGTDAYNLQLSRRRSEAVVADLVKRGIAASRLTAAGIGEARPLASNVDESGRAMNRRVEVKCQ